MRYRLSDSFLERWHLRLLQASVFGSFATITYYCLTGDLAAATVGSAASGICFGLSWIAVKELTCREMKRFVIAEAKRAVKRGCSDGANGQADRRPCVGP